MFKRENLYSIFRKAGEIFMKIVIKENQAGFVIKNGIFVKMLTRGQYFYPKAMGYEVVIEEMSGEVDFMELPYEVLIKDKKYKASVIRFQIPDGFIGLIYVNGTLRTFATRTEYIFWNVYETYEIKLISMEETEMNRTITKQMLSVIPGKYYTKICVGEGETGVLYFNNTLQKQLAPGIYYFWNYKVEVSYRIVSLKLNELNIIGQEILTRDKIGIRMNVTCSYKITDAVGVLCKIADLSKQLYSYVQLVIRELVGNYKLDEILEQKGKISEEIYKKLREKETEFCVEFVSSGIKDIILPGEIRDIMNTVLVAEKTAQANVITRREEVASTRSLLNTAKLMEENKTLYKLKELEYLEKICTRVGEISVNGNSGLVEQLGM